MRSILGGIASAAKKLPSIKFIYPLHKNAVIGSLAASILGKLENVILTDPLPVYDFHNLLFRCKFVITDSGGIQEEASSLGKPVLVMRDTTERPEGVQAGTLKLVGTDEETIYGNFKLLLEDETAFRAMTAVTRPYGDGLACKRIADILEE
jgi:UDP-N-acetylglucosamine 2-epimerase (non-hydrolysing)